MVTRTEQTGRDHRPESSAPGSQNLNSTHHFHYSVLYLRGSNGLPRLSSSRARVGPRIPRTCSEEGECDVHRGVSR